MEHQPQLRCIALLKDQMQLTHSILRTYKLDTDCKTEVLRSLEGKIVACRLHNSSKILHTMELTDEELKLLRTCNTHYCAGLTDNVLKVERNPYLVSKEAKVNEMVEIYQQATQIQRIISFI